MTLNLGKGRRLSRPRDSYHFHNTVIQKTLQRLGKDTEYKGNGAPVPNQPMNASRCKHSNPKGSFDWRAFHTNTGETRRRYKTWPQGVMENKSFEISFNIVFPQWSDYNHDAGAQWNPTTREKEDKHSYAYTQSKSKHIGHLFHFMFNSHQVPKTQGSHQDTCTGRGGGGHTAALPGPHPHIQKNTPSGLWWIIPAKTIANSHPSSLVG